MHTDDRRGGRRDGAVYDTYPGDNLQPHPECHIQPIAHAHGDTIHHAHAISDADCNALRNGYAIAGAHRNAREWWLSLAQ